MPLRAVHCDVLMGRQLQHGRVLSFAQMRQQHDFPVRKLKRIMMNVRLVLVDLSEHSHPMPELTPWAEHEATLALHLFLESKLCAGKQAYGHIGLADRSKTTRNHAGRDATSSKL